MPRTRTASEKITEKNGSGKERSGKERKRSGREAKSLAKSTGSGERTGETKRTGSLQKRSFGKFKMTLTKGSKMQQRI